MVESSTAARPERTTSSWLHRFAWLTAGVTFLLICSGGLVTSKGVGLAVPDWPTTFGYNMFLFPFSQWIGGIFYEHTHRLIASTVGFMTIILAVWLWRADSRRWMRILGMVALVTVVLQGVLGGLRVTMLKDEIGIFHACLAQAFLALLVFIALATSRLWGASSGIRMCGRKSTRLALMITALIYLQLALGASMRHQHRDLSILDFPTAYGDWIPDVSAERLAAINISREKQALSEVTQFQIWLQMAHRLVALVITSGIVAFWFRLRLSSAKAPVLKGLSSFWTGLVFCQVMLGAWTIWSNKAADIATAHVAVGAIIFAVGVTISAILFRGARGEGLLPAARGPFTAQGVRVL